MRKLYGGQASQELDALIAEIDAIIESADNLLSAGDVQRKLDKERTHEEIARALRVAMERGVLEITRGMKLKTVVEEGASVGAMDR